MNANANNKIAEHKKTWLKLNIDHAFAISEQNRSVNCDTLNVIYV